MYYKVLFSCLSGSGTIQVVLITRITHSQVGCGAIGCEMMKNYAMLGVGRGPSGLVGDIVIHHTCMYIYTCTCVTVPHGHLPNCLSIK